MTAGNPNIVSLTKLLTRLLKLQVDSYYLLVVKFIKSGQQFQPRVYFFDLLDYLDFTNFDLGPGQIMLQEKQFYEFVDGGQTPPTLSLQEKVDKCVVLMQDAYERLLNNRKVRINKLTKQITKFKASDNFILNQEGLFFGG